MDCAVCGKALYGVPNTAEPMVCGSCSLTPLMTPVEGEPGMVTYSKRGKTTRHSVKSASHLGFEHRRHLMTQPIVYDRELPMKRLKVRSNFARNRVVALTDGYPLVFDREGMAWLPEGHKPAFDVEASARPGRYVIVEEPALDPMVVIQDLPTEVPVVVKEEDTAVVLLNMIEAAEAEVAALESTKTEAAVDAEIAELFMTDLTPEEVPAAEDEPPSEFKKKAKKPKK